MDRKEQSGVAKIQGSWYLCLEERQRKEVRVEVSLKPCMEGEPRWPGQHKPETTCLSGTYRV